MATYQVDSSGKAQKGLSVGDKVVTNGGTYTITGVNSDGSYKSTKTSDAHSNNYSKTSTSTKTSSSGSSSSSTKSSTNSSGSSNNIDYSAKILEAIQNGADAATVQSYLDARNAKIANNSSLSKYANDAYTTLAEQYISSQNSGNAALQAALAQLEEANQRNTTQVSDLDSMLEDYYNQIVNRDSFSYDLNSDALYDQYAQKYTQNGSLAMQDTLGQAAALTGGYDSTYGQVAGQQTYDSYMSSLNDIIPTLYQQAYQEYQDEGDTLNNNFSMLESLWGNAYNEYNTDYNNYLSTLEAAIDQYNTDRSYNASLDETEKSELEQKAATMAAIGDFSYYEDLGYSDEDIAKLQAAYQAQQAATTSTGSGGSSGGSSGSGSGSNTGNLTLTQAEKMLSSETYTDEAISMVESKYGSDYLVNKYSYNPYTGEKFSENGMTASDFSITLKYLKQYANEGRSDMASQVFNSAVSRVSKVQYKEMVSALTNAGYSMN